MPKGIPNNGVNNGWFKKGSKVNLGRKHTEKTKRKIGAICKGKNLEEKNANWKGDNAKPLAMHTWVERRMGKARSHKCVLCPKEAQEWSNKDHTYKRKLDDYQALCKGCHKKWDYEHNGIKCYGRENK